MSSRFREERGLPFYKAQSRRAKAQLREAMKAFTTFSVIVPRISRAEGLLWFCMITKCGVVQLSSSSVWLHCVKGFSLEDRSSSREGLQRNKELQLISAFCEYCQMNPLSEIYKRCWTEILNES